MADQANTPLTPAVFALLLSLHRGARHGYALMGEVEELTGGVVRLGPGTLYRSLQRMRVESLVEEIDAPDEIRDDRRAERRREYRITETGREAAHAEARRLAMLVRAAREVGMADDDI